MEFMVNIALTKRIPIQERAMTVLRHARAYLAAAPAEAAADVAGIAGICLVVFCGFALPGLF